MEFLQKTYFFQFTILISILSSSIALSVIKIEPFQFNCFDCGKSHRHRCMGGEDEDTQCRPVFGYELQLNPSKTYCSLTAGNDESVYCPHCNYTAPQSCGTKYISKEDLPYIIYKPVENSKLKSMCLYVLITHGNMGVDNKLYERDFQFNNITILKNTRTQKTINDSCFSLDFNISIICAPHFYGDNCDIECRPSRNSTTGYYRCDDNGRKVCLTGWMGENCTEVDRCASNPCENNGTCSQNNTEYICSCTDEFSGPNCSISVYDEETTTIAQTTEIYPSSTNEDEETTTIVQTTEIYPSSTNEITVTRLSSLSRTERPNNMNPTSVKQITDTRLSSLSRTERPNNMNPTSVEQNSKTYTVTHKSTTSSTSTEQVKSSNSSPNQAKSDSNGSPFMKPDIVIGICTGGTVLVVVIGIVLIVKLRKRIKAVNQTMKKINDDIDRLHTNGSISSLTNPLYDKNGTIANFLKSENETDDKTWSSEMKNVHSSHL